MIRYGDLLAGFDNGIVKFILEPGQRYGTVCNIGDNWFYFGGQEAEVSTPGEYIASVGARFALERVYDALNSVGSIASMDKADPDEYAYYEAVLEEAGCSGHIA